MKLKLLILILVVCFSDLVEYAKGLDEFQVSECGKTKSCLLWNSCNFNNCSFGVSWKMVKKHSKDYLELELVGKLRSDSLGYVAVGFSDDMKMGEDGVVGCYSFNSTLGIRAGHNFGKVNRFLNSTTVDDDFLLIKEPDYGVQFSVNGADYVLRCRFARLMGPVKSANFLKDLTQKSGGSYFLWAVGKMRSFGGFSYHYSDRREPFEKKVQFYLNQHILVRLTSKPNVPSMVKAHACLMLCGWILLLTNGIFLAAFYKPNWPSIKILGKALWFPLHVSLQILGLICVTAAFIIIFVHVNGYSRFDNTVNSAHPIIGIISTTLLLLNPVISIFRCGPSHPMRPLFNWIHRSVGIASYILALITVIIGLQLRNSNNKQVTNSYPWILATIFMGLIIALYIYGRFRQRIVRKTFNYDHQMKETHGDGGHVDDLVNSRSAVSMSLEVLIASAILSVCFTVALIIFVLIE